jgi:hypothetical protein
MNFHGQLIMIDLFTHTKGVVPKILGPKLRANGFNFFEVFRHFNWGGFPQL